MKQKIDCKSQKSFQETSIPGNGSSIMELYNKMKNIFGKSDMKVRQKNPKNFHSKYKNDQKKKLLHEKSFPSNGSLWTSRIQLRKSC